MQYKMLDSLLVIEASLDYEDGPLTYRDLVKKFVREFHIDTMNLKPEIGIALSRIEEKLDAYSAS